MTERCSIDPEKQGPQAADRLEAARKFAIQAARLAAHTRSHSVVVLDVAQLSPVTDFFVIATGTSARQMRTVADEISEYGEKNGFTALSTAGYEGDSWILVDFVDMVFHIFSSDARQFYDLEHLWGDARRVEWRDPNQPADPPSAPTGAVDAARG